MSKNKEAIEYVYKKGYFVNQDGSVVFRGRKRSLNTDTKGYLTFTIRLNINDKSRFHRIRVHQLQAYQKYGEVIFDSNIQVRHLDSNKTNNQRDNILIGTPSENMMDIPEHIRKQKANYATSFVKTTAKEKVKEILEDRAKGFTYKQLKEKYGVSKSTLSYLFNEAKYASNLI